MDTEQAKRIWALLQSAVSEIYNKNASLLSFEELYRSASGVRVKYASLINHIWGCRNAYNLVLHKHGDLLYEGVQETVETRLRSVSYIVLVLTCTCTVGCRIGGGKPRRAAPEPGLRAMEGAPGDYGYGPRYPHVHGSHVQCLCAGFLAAFRGNLD